MRLEKSLLFSLMVLFIFVTAPLLAVEPPKAKRLERNTSPYEKIVIGEAEYFHIPELEAKFEARIDTGATTTSIYALNIEEFERDGKPWVRFMVIHPAKKKEYPLEKPVARIAQIKKRGAEGFTKRPAVELDLVLGELTKRVKVNLADRTGFEYPLLIGRDFLRGIALVDVSLKHTQKTSVNSAKD